MCAPGGTYRLFRIVSKIKLVQNVTSALIEVAININGTVCAGIFILYVVVKGDW